MQQPAYNIRFFFDYGGSCFWSGNDTTRQKFGYLIQPEKLPLSPSTINKANELISWFTSTVDWPDPPYSDPWYEQEWDRFLQEARELYTTAKKELGEEFVLHTRIV